MALIFLRTAVLLRATSNSLMKYLGECKCIGVSTSGCNIRNRVVGIDKQCGGFLYSETK